MLTRIDAGSTRSSFNAWFRPDADKACGLHRCRAVGDGGWLPTALLQDDLADAELIATASGAEFSDMDGGVAADLAGEDPL